MIAPLLAAALSRATKPGAVIVWIPRAHAVVRVPS